MLEYSEPPAKVCKQPPWTSPQVLTGRVPERAGAAAERGPGGGHVAAGGCGHPSTATSRRSRAGRSASSRCCWGRRCRPRSGSPAGRAPTQGTPGSEDRSPDRVCAGRWAEVHRAGREHLEAAAAHQPADLALDRIADQWHGAGARGPGGAVAPRGRHGGRRTGASNVPFWKSASSRHRRRRSRVTGRVAEPAALPARELPGGAEDRAADRVCSRRGGCSRRSRPRRPGSTPPRRSPQHLVAEGIAGRPGLPALGPVAGDDRLLHGLGPCRRAVVHRRVLEGLQAAAAAPDRRSRHRSGSPAARSSQPRAPHALNRAPRTACAPDAAPEQTIAPLVDPGSSRRRRARRIWLPRG